MGEGCLAGIGCKGAGEQGRFFLYREFEAFVGNDDFEVGIGGYVVEVAARAVQEFLETTIIAEWIVMEKHEAFDIGMQGNVYADKRCTVAPIAFFKRFDKVEMGIKNQSIGILIKGVIFGHCVGRRVVVGAVTGMDKSMFARFDTIGIRIAGVFEFEWFDGDFAQVRFAVRRQLFKC